MIRSTLSTIFVVSILFVSQGALAKKPIRTPNSTPTPTPTPVSTASITVLPSNPTSVTAAAGTSFQLTYNFNGGPTSTAMTVFVHFVNSNDVIVFGDDHAPPTATNAWTGSTSYTRTIRVPATVPAASYKILVGLYDQTTGARLALVPGSGVSDAGSSRYQVGTMVVAAVTVTPSPTPAPTPAPTPTPTASIPAGYTATSASSFGVKCDGASDDTAALQSALNSLGAYKALQLPAGTCVTSAVLRLQSKANVAVVGAGMNSTILKAMDPLRSAFVIYGSTNVTVQDLQIYSPNTTVRTGAADGNGFYVEHSSGVRIERAKSNNVSAAGFLFYVVSDSSIRNSEVAHSWSDSFHATGGSRNIVFENNVSRDAGDDCYASIGYGAGFNYNVQFLNNQCYGNDASGVSFEGTIGGKAYGNHLERTGVAAVRVDSQQSYSTGAVSQVDIRNNTLVNVRTRTEVAHAAVMIYTDRETIDRITFSNNVIRDPLTSLAIRVFGLNGILVRDSSIQNNLIQDSTGSVSKCVSLEQGVSNVISSGNTKNGSSCNN